MPERSALSGSTAEDNDVTLTDVARRAEESGESPLALLRRMFGVSEPSKAAWARFGALAVAAENSLRGRLTAEALAATK